MSLAHPRLLRSGRTAVSQHVVGLRLAHLIFRSPRSTRLIGRRRKRLRGFGCAAKGHAGAGRGRVDPAQPLVLELYGVSVPTWRVR